MLTESMISTIIPLNYINTFCGPTIVSDLICTCELSSARRCGRARQLL
uniref:Uncharacterized protein n=1 Tax=Anguilla anguilla TaxID=7936 RepID=A0A0E9SXT0_ANGAN